MKKRAARKTLDAFPKQKGTTITMRKTLDVRLIIERANTFLATSDDDKIGQREGVASFLEALLHDANAYAGFGYLPSAGVNYDGIARGERFAADDESRRRYNTHAKLNVVRHREATTPQEMHDSLAEIFSAPGYSKTPKGGHHRESRA